MSDKKLIIGMPAGSLANPDRGGNLINFLENSGFKTSGYESGGPSKFVTNNFLFGWDGRPQEFGSQLGIGELDIAIAGDDWIKERILELDIEFNKKINLEKVLPLKRGGVKIVSIIYDEKNCFENINTFLKEKADKSDLLVMVSEMPYLALDWLRNKLKAVNLLDKFAAYSVQKYKTPPRIQKGIIIYETWGKTEAKVKNLGADIGLEITQTGSAIKNYGLKIIDTVMESETGIWINPEIRDTPEKLELLRMFLLNLYGTINAESKVLIIFNLSNKDINQIETYLRENNLFADEPTISKGKNYSEYSIQIETNNPQIPISKIRYELARLGAKNIDTVPLTSSIPHINVIRV